MTLHSKAFCDEAKVKFIAGKGGDGCASFRREKFVAKGGPNGGDGGKGGDVILLADPNISTLIDFAKYRRFKADNGDNGRSKEQYGKYGENLVLKVPVGTIVKNLEGEVLADLNKAKEKVVIAKGGKGGKGNVHFKSSTHQAPTFAEKGEPGETLEAMLELKLVGDVGIIGLPSAGKSTLLSIISNAKPKIAAYHFTTLIPNLGIVDLSKYTGEKGNSFIAADIPGLIQEAHKGKGLGHQFLKHISRTLVLIHLVDGSLENPYQNFEIINNELSQYDSSLKQKPQIILVNKMDLLDEQRCKEISKEFKKHKKEVLFISAVSKDGLKEALLKIWQELKREESRAYLPDRQGKEREVEEKETKVILRPHLQDEKAYKIYKLQKSLYKVSCQKLEQLTVMTDINHPFGKQRIYKYLNASGIEKALIKEGVKEGDSVIIGEKQITFQKLV